MRVRYTKYVNSNTFRLRSGWYVYVGILDHLTHVHDRLRVKEPQALIYFIFLLER